MESLPYDVADITAMVTTANSDGTISDGFGHVRVRAMDGRALAIEITEDLSGLRIAAVLDFGRPTRARTALQADALCDAVRAASGQDGLPTPFPTPS